MFNLSRKKLIIILVLTISSGMLTGCFSKLKAEKEVKQEAITMFTAKDYANAALKFDEAFNIRKDSRIDASRADILEYKAEALYLSGNYAAADGVYAVLSGAYPEDTDYMDLRVICICKADGDIAAAKALYDASQNKINALNARGRQNDASTSSAGRAYDIHTEALCELTLALSKTEEGSKEALAYYSDITSDDSRLTAKFCNQIGRLYYMGNDYANAINFYEKGLALNGDDNTVKALKFNLAVAYEASLNFDKALELFNEYVKNYGGEENALHELSFIKSRVKTTSEN